MESNQLNSLLNNLQVGVARTSIAPEAKFLYTNHTMEAILGYSAQEIKKFAINKFFKDERAYALFMQFLKEEGFVKNFEAKLACGGNKIIIASISATVAKDGKGKSIAYDFVIQDITLSKRIERTLVESKELFQMVYDNSAVAITVADKNGRIFAWNPFTEKMLGMRREDLFNKLFKGLFSDYEWDKLASSDAFRRDALSDVDTEVSKKDGSTIDVSLSITTLRNMEGDVVGSLGIMRDISHQKAAERQLRESEYKIRIILDNSAAAITMIDDQERIVTWNQYTEQLLGMKKKDLHLRPVKTLYPPEEWEKIRAAKIRQIGSKHHMESKMIKKNGDVIDVELSVNVLKDAFGNLIGAVGIAQNITERKRFQEMLIQAKMAAEEANSTKSLFLANMSHEVRTPMNTILGMIDLTLDSTLTEEQKDNLVVAKDAADNLLGLINDILDLSRAESGKMRLEDIEFHLPNVVRNICKGMSVLAKKKSLGIVVDIAVNAPELLVGDPVRLRQVLVNLINNAIKFTFKGNIRVEVKVVSRKAQEVVLVFSVIDEGIGIPKDKIDRLFNVFSQVDDSTTRRFGGTGLGLAISKRLVEMMGGEIGVESEESKGSRFYFTTAFEVAENGQSAVAAPVASSQEPTNGEDASPALKNLRILLAEDNPVGQKIAKRLLEKQGWMVEVSDNGQDVVDRVMKENFDVVLMDAHMPILDGLEATRIIRKNEEHTGKHVAIIALTARAMEEDRRKCLEAGMDGYVTKPIDRNKLYEEIINYFSKGKHHGEPHS